MRRRHPSTSRTWLRRESHWRACHRTISGFRRRSKVRQLSHYQFSFRARDADQKGTWTLQLVLDEGAWEEIITLTADDADNLQDLLQDNKTVFYDIDRRLFMFGIKKTGD